jgi:hypothetical protein
MTDTVAPTIHWRRAQRDLWVATDSAGKPIGIVTEKWVHGFVATGRSGRNLGSHTTLAAAEAAVEATA